MMQRADGRTSTQLRPMECLQGHLHRADGSAQFSWKDQCKVICSVVGPSEVKMRDELLDKATLQIIFKPLVGMSSTQERFYERILMNVADALIISKLYPRTLIQMVVQVLAEEGDILSTAVNAMVLALMDAGIPLISTATAICCCIDKQGNVLLEPSRVELQESESSHVFVFSAKGDMLACHTLGPCITQDTYFACWELCQQAAERVYQFIRMAVKDKISKEFNLTEHL